MTDPNHNYRGKKIMTTISFVGPSNIVDFGNSGAHVKKAKATHTAMLVSIMNDIVG
jgi:hypothetical protein